MNTDSLPSYGLRESRFDIANTQLVTGVKMMQEVDSTMVSGSITDHTSTTSDHRTTANIADQLKDAAQTNVPQALLTRDQVVPSAEVAAISLTPMTSTTPESMCAVAPPMTGFVRGGIMQTTPGKQPYVPPPELAATAPPGSRESSPGVGSYGVSQITTYPSPQVPQSQPMAPAPMPSPHEISCDVPIETGPIYPTPTEKTGRLAGWFGSGLVNRMMEKTKSSMESMITTLDPGMKQVIYSGGDLNVVVTSTKAVKIEPVRQAFQEAFGRATVIGKASQPTIAPQPVGYAAALQGAEQRINQLRQSGSIDPRQVAVSVENFIVELLPDKWFDIGCVLLRDATASIALETFTQATPVSVSDVARAQEQTPPDYPLRWSGLAATVGDVIHQSRPDVSPGDWHLRLAGVSRSELIYMAARSLVYSYKNRLAAVG